MLILVHRKMNVLYVWLVSSKYIHGLQSYGKSPITSGSPLVYVRLIDLGGEYLRYRLDCSGAQTHPHKAENSIAVLHKVFARGASLQTMHL